MTINGTIKAELIRHIGYKNQKRRGLDSGRKVFEFLCSKYNLTLRIDKDSVTYITDNWNNSGQPWAFRTVACTYPERISYWEHIWDICDFIIEDIEDYNNGKYWPEFKI